MRLDDPLKQDVVAFVIQHGATIEAVLDQYAITQAERANNFSDHGRDIRMAHAEEILQIRIQLSELNRRLP